MVTVPACDDHVDLDLDGYAAQEDALEACGTVDPNLVVDDQAKIVGDCCDLDEMYEVGAYGLNLD